jgi:hypothetical protein
MTIKYQMFISSTWLDLESERTKVIQSVLDHYHFPIGMEMFSAANEAQWKTIQRTIDTSDIYILIVGHRYGSIATVGKKSISYTEKEFEYALSKKIPILAFIRKRNHPIEPEKVDVDNKVKLDNFIARVGKTVMYQTWTTGDDLATKVSTAFIKTIDSFREDTNQNVGWIKRSSLPKPTLEDISVVKNRSLICDFLQQNVLHFPIETEDVETYNFDIYGNCISERKRTQLCLADTTHSISQYVGDIDGFAQVIDVTDSSTNKLEKKLDWLICDQSGNKLTFCVLFDGIIKAGNNIRYKTRVSIQNYIANLITEGYTTMEFIKLSSTVLKLKKDILIFPDKKVFKNLVVTLKSVYHGDNRNEIIIPVISNGKKSYSIDYGTIRDECFIVIELKIN